MLWGVEFKTDRAESDAYGQSMLVGGDRSSSSGSCPSTPATCRSMNFCSLCNARSNTGSCSGNAWGSCRPRHRRPNHPVCPDQVQGPAIADHRVRRSGFAIGPLRPEGLDRQKGSPVTKSWRLWSVASGMCKTAPRPFAWPPWPGQSGGRRWIGSNGPVGSVHRSEGTRRSVDGSVERSG